MPASRTRARAGPTLPRSWRLALLRHRRLLGAAAAAAAITVALEGNAPASGATTAVLAAARDLRAGTALTEPDLMSVGLPADAVPAGALRPGAEILGRVVFGHVRAGEPLTDVRLLGPGLLQALAAGTAAGTGTELVAAPVRLADAGAAALLRVGDRVDILAAPVERNAAASGATLVAQNVVVLATGEGDGDFSADGALVVVATTSATARRLAHAATTARLSVTLRG